jgi:putative membrane protein
MQHILILGIAIAIAAVAFALQNDLIVTVTLAFWSFDSSLAMVLLLAAGVGALIAVLLSWPGIIKSLWENSRLRKQVSKLEEDKAALEQRKTQLEEEVARLNPQPIPEEPPQRYLGLKSMLLGGENRTNNPGGSLDAGKTTDL